MTRRRPPMTLTTLEDRWTPAVAGTLDPTFGVGGRQTYPVAGGGAGVTQSSLVVKPDGKLVLVGSDGTAGFTAVGVNRDGTLDTAFGQGGTAAFKFGTASDFANAAVAQPDGKVILVGSTFAGSSSGDAVINFAVARLTATGTLDPTFGAGGKVTYGSAGAVARQAVARAVAAQPDGRIVVAGSEYDPTSQTANVLVVRFFPNGVVDTGFGVGGAARVQVGASDSVAGVALLPDGRVVVAGTVGATANAGGDLFAVRLTAAGVADPTFGTSGQAILDLGQVETARALAVQPDGKIVVVGGTAAGADGTGALTAVAVRLDAAGKFDPTFNGNGRVLVDLGPQATASGVAVQRNGKLVLSRGPTTVAAPGLVSGVVAARLNADGTPDQSFGGSGRLGSDGTLDLTDPLIGRASGGFDADPAANLAVALEPGGGVVLAGTSGAAFAAARYAGDVVPVPAGAVFVGGTPDGKARVLAPSPDNLQPFLTSSFYRDFPGSVRTATADVNGDGVPDYVTGPGPGGGPNVVVTDGKTGAKLADFNAFETSFTGGVFVAVADLNGDGKADLVVTPDQGGGPVVAIFDGASLSAGKGAAAELTRFFGIDDPAFRGGARPALGDVNGDGRADLVVAAGFGGGPRVAVYDGSAVSDPARRSVTYVNTVRVTKPFGTVAVPVYGQPPKLTGDFFVFEPTLRNGVFVAAGDLTGDGKAEVVVGGGPGGGPRVMALSGASLLGGQMTPVANFFAGDSASRGGVRVAVRPAADGTAQIVTGSGEGQPGRVSVYKAETAIAGGLADQVVSPFGDAALADGVFVG